jgi:hypothetical protein
MGAAIREEGGGGGNGWWARVRGERTPRWVARGDTRGTRFRLSSAELTGEPRFGLRTSAGLRGYFRLRWTVPKYINRANKHVKFG